MKKILLILLISCIGKNANAQSSSGLIAHWDMNGEVNDVTGNGHNGTAHDLVSDTGMSGLPNTAYYFNGTSSMITGPYLSDLNVSKYSICATINVKGFYSGLCQGNNIFCRGIGANTCAGCYELQFNDNPTDNDCYTVDSSGDYFCATGGDGATSEADWAVGAVIVKDKWYKVVLTYNETQFQIFVNDTLINTVPVSGSIDSSEDSMCIGCSVYSLSEYPYYFKGLIDDIRLYNRVLTDSEVVHYGDTCGTIVSQPASSSCYPGGSVTYTINYTTTGALYQWQEDVGTGFVNLSDSGPYSGVTTNTLTISAATSSMNNYHYRCVAYSTWGCSDTSVSAVLNTTLGINSIALNDNVLIYPNPVQQNLYIEVPYINNNGSLQLINDIGQVLYEKTISSKKLSLNVSALPAGIYTARIELDGQVVYRKVSKN